MVKLKRIWSALFEWLLLLIGRYDQYARLPNSFSPKRVIFVCKGNVCRSVYAEFYLRSRLEKPEGPLEVLSCGLATDGNTPANPSGARMARQRGIDLAPHASIKAQSLNFGERDLVVVMEPYMVNRVAKLGARNAKAQILLLGMLGNPRCPSIPDPFGASDTVFSQVFDLIEAKIDILRSKIL